MAEDYSNLENKINLKYYFCLYFIAFYIVFILNQFSLTFSFVFGLCIVIY